MHTNTFMHSKPVFIACLQLVSSHSKAALVSSKQALPIFLGVLPSFRSTDGSWAVSIERDKNSARPFDTLPYSCSNLLRPKKVFLHS